MMEKESGIIVCKQSVLFCTESYCLGCLQEYSFKVHKNVMDQIILVIDKLQNLDPHLTVRLFQAREVFHLIT